MPKIVVMDKEVVKGVTICNYLSGGRKVEEIPVWTGDVLKDFAYTEGRMIRKLTGRLSNVNFAFNPAKVKNKNSIRDLASVNSVSVDMSSCYHANVVEIPAESVLEYRKPTEDEKKKENACVCPYAQKSEEEGVECKCKAQEEEAEHECPCDGCPKAPTCICDCCTDECTKSPGPSPAIDDTSLLPAMKLRLHLRLSDGTCRDMDIEEGDEFTDVIFTTQAPKIAYGHFVVTGFVYKGAGNNVDITGLILDNGTGTSYQVALGDIKSLGYEDVKVTAEDIKKEDGKACFCKWCEDDSIKSIDLVEPTRITGDVKFKKELAVRGINANTPANTGARATDDIDDRDENIFAGAISMKEDSGDASVSLIGVALTEKAIITYKAPKKLELINCKITGIEGGESNGNPKNYLVSPDTSQNFGNNTKPALVTISGCYFGPNKEEETE